jgi:hypothetical protein
MARISGIARSIARNIPHPISSNILQSISRSIPHHISRIPVAHRISRHIHAPTTRIHHTADPAVVSTIALSTFFSHVTSAVALVATAVP